MMRYSVQPRDRMFVTVYGSLSFAKNMGKNISKNISTDLSGKYSQGMLAMLQKRLDLAIQSATDALKTASNRAIQKTAEATVDLIGKKVVDKVTKLSMKLTTK